MSTLLISATWLKNTSIIDNNVDDKIIVPHIESVQDEFILPLLGSNLYFDLIGQFTVYNNGAVPSGITNANYIDLVNTYLQKTIKYYVISELVIPLSYKFTNKNIVQKNSDNSQSASLSSLILLKDQMREKAEWYAKRTQLRLLAYPDKFPLYLSGNATIETIFPERTPYTGGMSLGGRKNPTNLPGYSEFEQLGCYDCE